MTSNLKKLNERFSVCEEQTRTCATAQRPECQKATAPRYPPLPCLLFFQVGSSSLGRGVGLVFLWCASSFSSLFFRFSVLVSRELSRSRGCAVAPARGVSRGGCAASPCSGKVPPDSRGQWHQEHRAPTQEPRNFSGISPQYLARSWLRQVTAHRGRLGEKFCGTFSRRSVYEQTSGVFRHTESAG